MVVKVIAGIAVAYMALRIAVKIAAQVQYKKEMDRWFPKFPSEYREAFMMECSKDMIEEDPYAKSLDRRIRRIEKDKESLERAKKKLEKRWSR